MKILDYETDFDFNDVENSQKLENSIEQTQIRLNNIKTDGKKTSEILREICKTIFDFYDFVFGEGASEKIFKGKQNLNLCLEAFKDTLKIKEEQEQKLAKDLKNFENELKLG